MMVGRELNEATGHTSAATSQELLSVERLTTSKLEEVSFRVHAGEVFGIAGLVGSGRTELGQALFGLDPIRDGQIRVRDRLIAPNNPRAAMEKGIGYLPEDRKQQGLMMQMGVDENASIAILHQLANWGWIDRRREHQLLSEAHRETALKAPSRSAPVSTLSGGNQQKVLLERWFLVDPEVIFLDDPTRGVDVGAKEEIYALIAEFAQRGKGVILVSSELPELLRCCDRIMVLQDGRNQGILDAQQASQEDILELAAHVVA